MLLVHLDWKWNLWRSSVSRNLKNEYLKKYEFFPEKVLKNYLIWFKDLKISLNMVSECILCVPGFPMTYRTCSNDVSDVSIHTLKSGWWQDYFRVCFQTLDQELNFQNNLHFLREKNYLLQFLKVEFLKKSLMNFFNVDFRWQCHCLELRKKSIPSSSFLSSQILHL